MRRVTIEPRPDWREKVVATGLSYHTLSNGQPYWNESAYYEFTSAEIDKLEKATNDLHQMALEAAQHVIDKNLFHRFGIPPAIAVLIEKAWEAEPPALYGRMDLAYNGNEIKLLEYNADTPTCLVEAAVTQWSWLEERYPDKDQFNSLHERLVAKLKELTQYCQPRLYFAHMDEPSGEDMMTVSYLAECALQAGFKSSVIRISDIGWHDRRKHFVDRELWDINSIFKLYPWEWLLRDEFGPHIAASTTQWIEPIWKMLLSNKAILPILWELYPDHPLLLEAYFDKPQGMDSYCQKPILGREGQNVTLVSHGITLASQNGSYSDSGYIYQGVADIPCLDGHYPIIGSWMIDQEAGGMGIRESKTPITDNLSSFVPHLFT